VEKPREIAARILRRYASGGDYLEHLLETELGKASLSPADRALAQELTFGVVRWQATLDWLIAQKTDGRPQKPPLQILLRLGLYQIFWLERIPDHAAVHETVESAKQLGFSSQSRFINAVLRGYLREKDQTRERLKELKLRQPALGFSHPDWLVERWQQRWGEQGTRELLEWNNTPPPIYARLNTLKSDAQTLTSHWEKEKVKFLSRQWSWSVDGLVFELTSHPPLTSLPSFQEGFFYVQDPSTLLAVRELDPKPGERILDVCAAPGGKTTFMAQHMQNTGHILAQDLSESRLERVRENCGRLGVTCVELGPLSSAVPGEPAPALFDGVLVDAPCSNTGVMRRRVDVRWRIRPEELQRLRAVQLDLLTQAATCLRQGGRLVYSTCSLEPEENEQVLQDFLAAHSRFALMDKPHTLLPFVDGVDGAFVATLRLRD
jgi:16S rRNA (cytosine967-C5)-methyltransferase